MLKKKKKENKWKEIKKVLLLQSLTALRVNAAAARRFLTAAVSDSGSENWGQRGSWDSHWTALYSTDSFMCSSSPGYTQVLLK